MINLSHLDTEIRADVAESLERAELVNELNPSFLRRHPWRDCPVCGDSFSLAGDVTEHASDTCSYTCAVRLEAYAWDHDLSADAAARKMRMR